MNSFFLERDAESYFGFNMWCVEVILFCFLITVSGGLKLICCWSEIRSGNFLLALLQLLTQTRADNCIEVGFVLFHAQITSYICIYTSPRARCHVMHPLLAALNQRRTYSCHAAWICPATPNHVDNKYITELNKLLFYQEHKLYKVCFIVSQNSTQFAYEM